MLAVETPLVRASFHVGEARAESISATALAEWKARVPPIIERVGRTRWNRAVNQGVIATARYAPGVVAINRAFHKLLEILMSCALPVPTRSVHLCEAPGGFVQATHHFVGDAEWTWSALTLPDGLRIDTTSLPIHCGAFVEGDVFREDEVVEVLGTADLVTGDGAVEMDHDRLEEIHLPLLQAQTRVALRLLRPEGTLVLKFFEGLHSGTWEWLANLTHCFRQVSVIKPTSSRPTNSERYVVGRGYLPGSVLVPTLRLSEEWEQYVLKVMERYATTQIDALRRVVALLQVK
jgi:23S rRNA U2552 (ribose-2'-O)-methylase RlmE/FtsJ